MGINGFCKVIIEISAVPVASFIMRLKKCNCQTRDPKSTVIIYETFGDSLERPPEAKAPPETLIDSAPTPPASSAPPNNQTYRHYTLDKKRRLGVKCKQLLDFSFKNQRANAR